MGPLYKETLNFSRDVLAEDGRTWAGRKEGNYEVMSGRGRDGKGSRRRDPKEGAGNRLPLFSSSLHSVAVSWAQPNAQKSWTLSP